MNPLTPIPVQVYREVFTSKKTLGHYLSGQIPSNEEIFFNISVDTKSRIIPLPDHWYDPRVSCLNNKLSAGQSISQALEGLSDHFLYINNDQVWVDNSLFTEWQDVLTDVPPLWLIVWKWLKHIGKDAPSRESAREAMDSIHRQFTFSTLPSIQCDFLDELQNEGLSDLHMHLNGSTEFDFVWRDALINPDKFKQKFMGGSDNFLVKELFAQDDGALDHQTLLGRLSIARILRAHLSAHATYVLNAIGSREQTYDEPPIKQDLLMQILSGSRIESINDAPLTRCGDEYQYFCLKQRQLASSNSGRTDRILQKEIGFLSLVFTALRAGASEPFQHALYAYLLLATQFMRLIIQQENQIGFDQFQKITLNEMREAIEEKFHHRFHQLDLSPNDSSMRLEWLEGRMAPSNDGAKNVNRLRGILTGYRDYLDFGVARNIKNEADSNTFNCLLDRVLAQNPSHTKLRLVAHFIKKSDSQLHKYADVESVSQPLGWHCRHYKLRTETEHTRRVFTNLLDGNQSDLSDKFKKCVVGFDAAANELHAPPEVFAPVFARLRKQGYKNFTYHAGEDYRHLLSGIRAVYEAIEHTGLENGDRVGHATACGIDPAIWRDRSGGSIWLHRGDRFDDIVIARKLLLAGKKHSSLCTILGQWILKEGECLYGLSGLTIDDYVNAWKLRRYDPLLAFELGTSHSDFIRVSFIKEISEIKAVLDNPNNNEAGKLYSRWHGVHDQFECVKRANQWVEVSLRDGIEKLLTSKIFRDLQSSVIQHAIENKVCFETLPTSNRRISFYHDYTEHHLLDWLEVGSLRRAGGKLQAHIAASDTRKQEGLKVVVGSDDTGIFATNMRNEFAHIYLALDRVNASDRKSHLNKLVAQGKTFRFE